MSQSVLLRSAAAGAGAGLRTRVAAAGLAATQRRAAPSLARRAASSDASPTRFRKLMAANRGEIAVRLLRAANELGIRSVAVYSHEDRLTAHRYKADESYLVGVGKSPVQAYLGIDEIVGVAKASGVDAVHPGYGFLSENPDFNSALEAAGITFVGPTVQNLIDFGDKTRARAMAIGANVPIVPGTAEAVTSIEEARAFTDEYGFPIIIKAAYGGGGRGMRVVEHEKDLQGQLALAASEAESAFGNGAVFLERYIKNPRHIEVQILGDGKGNVVHLYDRDCSVQRRHQKVLETAPAVSLPDATREAIFQNSCDITAAANYRNAGTVEFLVDEQGRHYFIEVNPRVQVEHTITEEVTGIDIVQSQIKIASGASLTDLGLAQGSIPVLCHAMQCRVTTEDPTKDFAPDSGVIKVFRAPTGMGIRLDDGPGFTGAHISPFYDSLLVKLTGRGSTREAAAVKLRRALAEFRIRGVQTNIPFLTNVLNHPQFIAGTATTSFIAENPDLVRPHKPDPKKRRAGGNRGQKLLTYLGHTVVNGTPKELGADVKRFGKPSKIAPIVPEIVLSPEQAAAHAAQRSLRQIYKEDGPAAFAKAVREHEGLLVTDTTWRDAHQSLLATRVRTYDLAAIAPATALALRNAYSIEMWGGATFDVALRFLRECPWQRLEQLRELVPDVPFQMLLRGANAVGYTSYPDNVVLKFCEQAVKSGMDVFRVFDSLNYLDNMQLGIEAVGAAGGIAEACVCYTGDVLRGDTEPDYRYNLDYYLETARALVGMGCHVLAIKDMAGLLKPKAATMLIGALRAEFPDMPIHVHTHDTAGTGVASMIACYEAGADAVDGAVDSMSGMTSQPSLGALVNTVTDTGVDPVHLAQINSYWELCRGVYAPFESGQKTGSADVFVHEIPGGQYTNMMFQASQLGLIDRWPLIKQTYHEANLALGDIIKVTPSSKVVGDLAQFMVTNEIRTAEELVIKAADGGLSFPSSIVEYFQGYLGIPHFGFPEPLRSYVLQGKRLPNGKDYFDARPGLELDPVDFEQVRAELEAAYASEAADAPITDTDVMSYCMYPQVFKEYRTFLHDMGDVSKLPTRNFVLGLEIGEEVAVEIEKGKTLYVTLHSISDVDEHGMREVYFELNGDRRVLMVPDEGHADTGATAARTKAVEGDVGSVGAPMPGVVVDVKAKVGDKVAVGDPLIVLSAMKMETVCSAPTAGVIKAITVAVGDNVKAADLVVTIEPAQ